MALQIIGAGVGRTGTSSLKTALEHLGFGPCHHMFEVRDNPAQLPGWVRATKGGPNDWDALFAGYRAQVDWPGARYWRELSEHYPDAKVILTHRDPEDWYRSVSATIIQFLNSRGKNGETYINDLAEMCHRLIAEQVFDGRMDDRDHAISVFTAHNAAVRATIPAERLLVYTVDQGWEPLCAFLECPVPAISFPHLNSSRQFTEVEWRR